MNNNPALTVIVAVGYQRARGAHCLKHILDQQVNAPFEILLYDDLIGKADPLPGSDHPAVRTLPFPLNRSYGDLFADGVQQARASVIALIEEHVQVRPGWAQAIIDAHRDNDYAIVSGEVHNGNPGSGASDSIHMTNYVTTMAPRPKGETTAIVGHNSTFKRAPLLAYADELADLFQNDTLLAWRLLKDGHTFFADPAIKIAHCNETQAASHLIGIFIANRAFGAARVKTFHWSWARRLFYVAIAPVAPFVRLARQVRFLRQHRPQLMNAALLPHLPVWWSFYAAAVAGQALGLLTGMGDARSRFLYFELNEYRHVPGVEDARLLRIRTPLFGTLPEPQ
ncbi:MAG: hypothetical protein SF162_08860 [bacterium]|nr:hypothetical protein [bacterium]